MNANALVWDVGRVLLGATPGVVGSVLFEVREDTPGMISDNVVLYTKTYSFTLLAQSLPVFTLDNSIVTTMNIPKVNEKPTYEFNWVSATTGVEYLIY